MTGEDERLQLRHRHAKMGVCRGCRESWPCPTWLLLAAYKEAVEALIPFEGGVDGELRLLVSDFERINAVLARAREQGVIE